MACDPGGTTGIALKVPAGIFTIAEPEKQNVWLRVSEFAQSCDLNGVVLVEQFASVWNDQHRIKTIELVGAIEAICWQWKIRCVRRTPQHRYPKMNEAKEWLKKRGGSSMKHEIDALAHILAWEGSLAARRPVTTA